MTGAEGVRKDVMACSLTGGIDLNKWIKLWMGLREEESEREGEHWIFSSGCT